MPVRKIAATIVLFVFLFNLIGYKFLFDYLQHQNDRALETVIDKEQYSENDLISVRIPLSMPYQPESTPFERVSGEITVGGMVYKYVKRRIDNGDLVLLCLPDRRKTELASGKDAFFRLANEFQQVNNKHQDGKTTSIFKLSVFSLADLVEISVRSTAQKTLRNDDYNCFIPQPVVSSTDPPPDTRA